MTVRNAILSGRVLRCLAVAGLAFGATTVAAVAVPATAHAAEQWAPFGSAPIHPGVMVDSPEGQCTANFIFRGNGKLYIGQAAHCTGTGSANETDGCKAKSLPLGTEVKIQGASKPGKLAYNSWLTMQEEGEKNENLCSYNDFALVEIDKADEDKVNPSIPHFGGPFGVRETDLPAGEKVYSFGNSGLRGGLEPLSPKEGYTLGTNGDGRTHEVVTLTPGVPGDSGSGFLDAKGQAMGVLSTLNLAPAPGSNGVSDLGKALAYAKAHGGKFELVNGTEPFHGGALPALPLAGSPADSSAGAQGSQDAAPGGATGGTAEPLAVNPKRTGPANARDFDPGMPAEAPGDDAPKAEDQPLLGGL